MNKTITAFYLKHDKRKKSLFFSIWMCALSALNQCIEPRSECVWWNPARSANTKQEVSAMENLMTENRGVHVISLPSDVSQLFIRWLRIAAPRSRWDGRCVGMKAERKRKWSCTCEIGVLQGGKKLRAWRCRIIEDSVWMQSLFPNINL